MAQIFESPARPGLMPQIPYETAGVGEGN